MSKVPPKPAAMGTQQRKTRAAAGGPQKPAHVPLSIEERMELRGIFASPTFAKAFSNARLMKPPVFVGGIAKEHGGKVATIRLAQLQGWEMFEAALVHQTMDKLPEKTAIEENYPDQP